MEDDFLHRPGDDEYWSESYYMDFVDEDVQGHARLGYYPNRGRANVWVYLIDGEAVYWAREEAIPPEDVHGTTVRRDDWTFAMRPEEAGREWTVSFEGDVTKSTSPADVLYDRGEPAELSLAFTFTGRHDLFLFSEGASERTPTSDRYEQATTVEGTADLDGREVALSGPGERDHSWGRRKWVRDSEWLWISGAFEDGTAYNHVAGWPVGGEPAFANGFWFDGEERVPLTGSEVTATPAFGEETGRAWMEEGDAPTIEMTLRWADGEATIEVEPFATTPIDWVEEESERWGVLNRSPARQARDGIGGTCFLENMTQFPLSERVRDGA